VRVVYLAARSDVSVAWCPSWRFITSPVSVRGRSARRTTVRWSHVDRMNFSFLSRPDLIPDLAPLAAELPRALDELSTMQG
jgi:hypothetical protein